MKRYPSYIQFKSESREDLETKSVLGKVEVKAEKEGGILHIKAYALAFGNIDSWGDIIAPGACDDFLKSDEADRMALCWQHDRRTVIGKITDKGVDDYGMWIEADILPTTAGKDAAVLIKSEAVKEFSIGYRTDRYRYEKRDGYDYEIRVIEALTVYEVSPVTIAANDRAKLISAKNQGKTPTGEQEPDKSNSPTTMTEQEIKAMRESIEKAATEKAAAEVKALQERLQAAQETIGAQEKSIDNLDKSMMSLQSTIDGLKAKLTERQVKDFKSAMRAGLEAEKPNLEKMFEAKADKFSIEIEIKAQGDVATTNVSPNNFTSVAVDLTIPPVTPTANAFILAFGIRPRTANKLGWLEPSATNRADYVAELAANNNKSDVSFAEKSRKFGKIAHTMRISTEFSDWFEQLYNYCVNEGVRMIEAKLDEEIWKGLGADSGSGTSPDKIYGIKSQSTAFSALGTYTDANIADVIFDAAMQAAKEGFNANAVFCTWAEYATLLNVKDKDGNRLFNQATQTIGGMRVYPNGRMDAGELLVADTGCAEVFGGRSFELEFIRNGVYDAYDVYYRRAAQVKVTTANKKGLIYVASVATAIAAITPAAAQSGTGS